MGPIISNRSLGYKYKTSNGIDLINGGRYGMGPIHLVGCNIGLLFLAGSNIGPING